MIDSGGFGCIYKPALRCSKSKKRHDGISKLQIKKYGLQEYKSVKSIEKELKKIPNYSDHYIVKLSKCVPNALSKEDKNNMNCYALEKRNITKKNINKNLSKLISIQMEYGGPTLKTTIKNIKSVEELIQVYRKMLIFFREGLIPMNQTGIFHNDMKLSNLVYGEYIKLIDWGFTININEKYDIKEKKFHFNLPFSVTVLEKSLYVETFFKDKIVTKTNVDKCVNIIMEHNKHDSHLEFLEELLNNLDIKHLYSYIHTYLSTIIYKYTDKKSKQFDTESYFNDVYIHNCDIWGFIIMFVEILDCINKDLLENNNLVPFITMVYTLLEKYLLNVK